MRRPMAAQCSTVRSLPLKAAATESCMPSLSNPAIVRCLACAAAFSRAAAMADESDAASECAVSIASTGRRYTSCGCGMSLREAQKSRLNEPSCGAGWGSGPAGEGQMR